MKKAIVAVAVVALVAIAGVLVWLGRDSAGAGSDAAAAMAQAGAGSSGGGAAALPTHFTTGLEALPASLRGTEVDGEFEVDASGHLKITNGIRHVFDYFLSTVGEEPVDTIIARIRAYIHSKLKEPAAGEAEHILDGYIAYKRGLQNLQSQQQAMQQAAQSGGQASIDIDAVRHQMEQVQALRTQYLSPEVIQAFFGDEDAYDRYTVARLQVIQNKSLSAAQRAQHLAALEQQLPASIQDSMKTINQYQNLQSLTTDCQQRHCAPAELRQIRENLVGSDAADRLENLDKDNAVWDQRMNSWYSQRDAILKTPSLSDQDRQSQLAQARNGLFNDSERVRVEALERIRDSGAKVSQ